MTQDSLVVCSKCGGVNRLPAARRAEDAKCGKCKSKLFSGHPEDVDGETFDRQIARSFRAGKNPAKPDIIPTNRLDTPEVPEN